MTERKGDDVMVVLERVERRIERIEEIQTLLLRHVQIPAPVPTAVSRTPGAIGH
jgi:hypothetical protein